MTFRIPNCIISAFRLICFIGVVYAVGSLMVERTRFHPNEWIETRHCVKCKTEVDMTNCGYQDLCCAGCGTGGDYQVKTVTRTSYNKPWYVTMFDRGVTETKPWEEVE